MSDINIKVDDKEFRKALQNYAAGSQRSFQAVLKQQAGLFVKDVVSVTPPSQGKTSPKLGYAAVKSDILRALREQDDSMVAAGEQIGNPATLHRKVRNKYTGRVVRGVKQQPAMGVAAYIKKMLGQVGILASGWNAAAEELKVKLPPWITRHGTKRGQIELRFGKREIVIVATNAVKFAGNIKGIGRRVQWALNKRTRSLIRQVDYANAQAARRVGL